MTRGRGFAFKAALGAAVSVCVLAAFPGVSQAVKEKPFVPPVTEEPAPGSPVDVVANTITYDGKRKIATAIGGVRMVYGPYTLVATKVVYNQKTDTFEAEGHVEVREPNGNIVQSDYAKAWNRFKEGFARHVRALLTNDVTITADYARRYENGITIYERATYTACKDCTTDGGEPLWQLISEQTKHDQNTRTLYHTNPRLEVAGVPVFWMPYLSMPDPTVKRRSGFLTPSLKFGEAYGAGFVLPYFWELAPNYDLTFSPIWTTNQGPVADIEWRHRTHTGQYNIRGYGVYQFDRDPPPEDERWRGAVESNGAFSFNDEWSWGWNGLLTSDRTFLSRYGIDGRTIADNRFYVTGISDRNYFSAQTLYYQSLIENSRLTSEYPDNFPYALPYVQASYLFDQPVAGGELGLDWSVYSIHRDDSYFVDDKNGTIGHATDQTRAIAEMHWRRRMVADGGQVVTPFARLRSDIYVTEDLPVLGMVESETTARVLPSAGLDFRWPLISNGGFGQSTFTPVAQIIAASNETDEGDISNEDAVTLNFDHTSLFLEDRFTGFDRYESGTRANVGFVYSYYADNGGFARFSLGESFHVAGENSFVSGSGLDGTSSDLVGAIAFQPTDNLMFTYQARLEEDLSDVNVQEASVSLTLDRISGSLSYASLDAEPSYGRPSGEEQVWGDATYQLSEAWSLFGGFRYDIDSTTFLSKTLGIQFDCDCMTVRIAYSENDTENPADTTEKGLSLSVDFRTLGGATISSGL